MIRGKPVLENIIILCILEKMDKLESDGPCAILNVHVGILRDDTGDLKHGLSAS